MEFIHQSDQGSTLYIALLAVLTALTSVATLVLVVPIPATDGFFNFGDIMVMMSGLLLGPVGGFIAGGFGSMFADLIVAPIYAPITLIVKGLEGLAVGLLSQRTSDKSRIGRWDVIGVVVAAVIMLVGYLLGEILLWGLGPALIELVLFNSLQVTGGAVVTLIIGPKLRSYLAGYTQGVEELKE
jgi:uncharacterized membrane protein